jgi:hypothetical protein
MCVLKSTVTNAFKYARLLPTALSPQSSHPRGRPHYSSV